MLDEFWAWAFIPNNKNRAIIAVRVRLHHGSLTFRVNRVPVLLAGAGNSAVRPLGKPSKEFGDHALISPRA